MSTILDERAWVVRHTNRPLLTDLAAGQARVLLTKHGCPIHRERWKNWDDFLAVYHTVTRANPELDRVLDAGACRDPKYPSAYLPGLQKFGFRHLTGCNIDEKARVIENGIHYQYGDITKTDFPRRHFGFVSCLSVLEHGVDWRKFLFEQGRIIGSGGHLFLSFDYWETPIDAGDRVAFGAPVHIFDAAEVNDMIVYAADQGFTLDGTSDLRCQDKVVTWLGLSYTFLNLLFQRR